MDLDELVNACKLESNGRSGKFRPTLGGLVLALFSSSLLAFRRRRSRPLSKDDCLELRLLLERQFDPVPKGRLRDAVRLVERYDISDLLGSAS